MQVLVAGVVVYLQYQPSPSLLVTSRSPSWFGPVEKEPPRTKNGLNLTPIKAKQKLRGDGSPRGRFERRINFSSLPFGGDARALAGVLHACYRFPLTPITRGVENWNLSWQL